MSPGAGKGGALFCQSPCRSGHGLWTKRFKNGACVLQQTLYKSPWPGGLQHCAKHDAVPV
jgi:hypothetical protein